MFYKPYKTSIVEIKKAVKANSYKQASQFLIYNNVLETSS